MSTSSFGQRLRQFRVERQKSLRETAKAADISVTYLSKLESDEGNPTLDVLLKLASLYGVTIEDLTAGLSAEQNPPGLDPSLQSFIQDYHDKFPELLEVDWKNMLNGIRLRGRRPENTEDWLTIFLDLKRALRIKQD